MNASKMTIDLQLWQQNKMSENKIFVRVSLGNMFKIYGILSLKSVKGTFKNDPVGVCT